MDGVLTLEEVVLEAPLGHVLVDQQAVLLLAAVADEPDEVGVAQLAQEDDLRQPLLVALRALGVPQLDGDLLRAEPRLGALGHGAPVHGAEPALAQQRLRPEAARGLGQLGVREGARRDLARLFHLEDILGHTPVTVAHCIASHMAIDRSHQ